MSEKRVAPPDGGSGDLVLIQRHLENLSAGEILEELDVRMEEMTDQSCDPELIRLYLDVLEEKEPLGLELDPEASLQRFLEERAGEESRSTPPEEPAAQAAVSRPAGLRRFRHFPRTLIAAAVVAVLFGLGSMAGSSRLWESVVHLTQGTLQIVPPGASQSGQTSAQPPLEELEFTSLQEALDAYGIAEPLVPKWLPEGFESLGVTTNVDPDFIRIAETYSYDEKKIKIKTNYPVTPRQKRSRCRSNRGIIDSPTPLFTPFCRFRYRSRGQIHSHQYPRTSSTNDPFLKWFSYASRMMRIAMSTSPF